MFVCSFFDCMVYVIVVVFESLFVVCYDLGLLFFFVFFVDDEFVCIMYVFVFVGFWWVEFVDFSGYLINMLFVGVGDVDFCWFCVFDIDVFWDWIDNIM